MMMRIDKHNRQLNNISQARLPVRNSSARFTPFSDWARFEFHPPGTPECRRLPVQCRPLTHPTHRRLGLGDFDPAVSQSQVYEDDRASAQPQEDVGTGQALEEL